MPDEVELEGMGFVENRNFFEGVLWKGEVVGEIITDGEETDMEDEEYKEEDDDKEDVILVQKKNGGVEIVVEKDGVEVVRMEAEIIQNENGGVEIVVQEEMEEKGEEEEESEEEKMEDEVREEEEEGRKVEGRKEASWKEDQEDWKDQTETAVEESICLKNKMVHKYNIQSWYWIITKQCST